MKKTKLWEFLEFKAKHIWRDPDGWSIMGKEGFWELNNFFTQLVKECVGKEREKVRKIVADYQNFKIDGLGLEMALCDYLKKE